MEKNKIKKVDEITNDRQYCVYGNNGDKPDTNKIFLVKCFVTKEEAIKKAEKVCFEHVTITEEKF